MIKFYNIDKSAYIDIKQKYIDLLKSKVYHKNVTIYYHRRNKIEKHDIYCFYNSSTKDHVLVSCKLTSRCNSNKSTTLILEHVTIINKN